MSWKNRVAACRSIGRYPISSHNVELEMPERHEVRSRNAVSRFVIGVRAISRSRRSAMRRGISRSARAVSRDQADPAGDRLGGLGDPGSVTQRVDETGGRRTHLQGEDAGPAGQQVGGRALETYPAAVGPPPRCHRPAARRPSYGSTGPRSRCARAPVHLDGGPRQSSKRCAGQG